MNNNVILSANKKIYHSRELIDLGMTYYKINKMILNNKLNRLNKSYYENNAFTGEDNDFYYVTAYATEGVVCLMSAAVYYGLTNYRPESVDVAVSKKKNITTLPDWPILKLYYFDGYRYELGVNEVTEGENKFQIYNIEKTVVDIIAYRNKIGIEETKEILTNYLRRQDKNINQLIRYSEKLKCHDILKAYLEVLI